MGATEGAVARFTLTGDEYAEGIRAIMRRQPTFWIGPLLGVATLVVGVGAGQPFAMGWGVVVLVVAIASYWVAPALRWKKEPRLGVEQEHRFDDRGVTVRAGQERAQLPWDFYSAVSETPRVYVLLRNRRQANFVPKRGFASTDQEARFRALAAAHVRAPWRA